VSPGRPAAVDLARVRFYVDEQLAGLGLGLMALRSDIVVASHPPIADFPRDDPDWIPQVAAHGWVVITNDKHIRTRPGEAEVALQTGLRCVHLAPPARAAIRWDFARLLLRHWDAVDALCAHTGPVWLQLDRRATPWERPYQPGKPPRVPPADRPQRPRRTESERAKEPQPVASTNQNPPHDALPFPR
jgi:PIN like domain